jgi:hypothetical protein
MTVFFQDDEVVAKIAPDNGPPVHAKVMPGGIVSQSVSDAGISRN